MLRARFVLAAAVSVAVMAAAAAPALAARREAPIRQVQTRPIAVGGKVGSLVGRAAITRDGRLVVAIAGPGAGGAPGRVVLARARRDIRGIVSSLRRARLTLSLRGDGTGSALVVGPRNRSEPDSVLTEFRWRLGHRPSVRIVAE